MGSIFIGICSLLKVMFSNDPQMVKGRAQTEAYFTEKTEKFNKSCENLATGNYQLLTPKDILKKECHKFGRSVDILVVAAIIGGILWYLSSLSMR